MEETTEISDEPRRPQPNNHPFFSLFQKLPLFNFPPFKAKPEAVVVSEKRVVDDSTEESNVSNQVVVRFPDPRPAIPPPLKLEAEECEQNTNPMVLWQVYAIGGFFVFKWLWARWDERKARKKASDDEPSPADD